MKCKPFKQQEFCFADGLFNQYISQQEYKPRWGQIIPKSSKGKDFSEAIALILLILSCSFLDIEQDADARRTAVLGNGIICENFAVCLQIDEM